MELFQAHVVSMVWSDFTLSCAGVHYERERQNKLTNSENTFPGCFPLSLVVSRFPWLFPAFPGSFLLSPDVPNFPHLFPAFPRCFPLSMDVFHFLQTFPTFPGCFPLSPNVSWFPIVAGYLLVNCLWRHTLKNTGSNISLWHKIVIEKYSNRPFPLPQGFLVDYNGT